MSALIVGAAAVAAGLAARGSRGGHHDSAVVAEHGTGMAFRAPPPTSYAITYRVDQAHGPRRVERLVVDRPWRSASSDGTSARVSDFGLLGDKPAPPGSAGLVTPPALAVGDSRPDIALPSAVAAGVATLGERRRVAGVACQVYRTAFPLDAGPITAPGADRTESCVDARGLVLEEVQVVDNRPSQRRTATSVEERAVLNDADVAVAPPALSVSDGGAGVRKLDDEQAARLAPRWTLHPPSPFAMLGQYAVAYPSSDANNDPRAFTSRLATVITVWTNGADVVMFESGATLDGSAVAAYPGAIKTVAWPTPAGGTGPGLADLVLSARGNELRHTSGGELVRLMATVPPDELLAIAGSISPSGATP